MSVAPCNFDGVTKPFPVSHAPTDVFRGSEARHAGLVTKGELRGPKYRRLFQDVYVPADVPVDHALRCRGAALIVPAEAVLTGRSAATVRGVPLAKTHDPVEFVVPEKKRFGPIQGIHVRRTEVKRNESRAWHGIRIARPKRIALDLALRLSPRKHGWIMRHRIAVPDLDAYIRSGLVKRRALFQLFGSRRNRGIRLARSALWLSDPRAESLPESELRVVMRFGGLRPTPQFVVWLSKRRKVRLDLALVEEKVAAEYDGRWHLKPEQRRKDLARRRRLERAGWRVVVVHAEHLANDFQGILDVIRDAQRANRRR